MEEKNINISKSFISENRKSEERFFDDISNEDLIGLDVVDSWEEANSDNGDLDKSEQRSKTPSDYEKHHSPLLQHSSTDQSSSQRYDRKFNFALKRTAGQYNRPYKTRYDNQSKKYFDKKEISSETRRDPSKTKRDIQRDKDRCAKDLEAKVVEKKIKVAESGLCPPGMEDNMIENLDEFNVTSKQDAFLKATEEKPIPDDLEKQKSLIRKSPVKSSSRRRSPIYSRYRSSERFKDFRRTDSRSNVSRYSPDRYQPERHRYRSGYRPPLGKRMTRSPSLTNSSGSNVSVRETWLVNRQSKMRRSKSPFRERRKPFIEEIKHQLEEKSHERMQFRETSQMINRLPPQPNIYPPEYQHFPPMQYDRPPMVNGPPIMPPMCPNPYETIPHSNMNIPYPNVNIPHSDINIVHANTEMNMSYTETHVPPHEMNILPVNTRVLDVPNPNSMQYLPNFGSNPQNPILSLPNSDVHSSNSMKFGNIPLPIVNRASPEKTHQLIDTSTYMTARPKSNEEKNTISKLFQDKKINLSDFLAATATEDSSSFNIQEKIKVISRCQDAIKNLSFDLNKTTQFIPTSLCSDVVLNLKKNQNQNKWLSPIKKLQIVSVPFTENSDKKTLVHDRLQKLLATLQLPTLAAKDSPSSLPTPPAPHVATNKSNQSAKFVQTDTYKCEMCEYHNENKKSLSIQTEKLLTYDIGVQVNMEDTVVDYRNQGRIKSILKNAPPPPSISHMTAAQLLQMSEPEKNNEQSSDFGLQAQFDSFKSRSLNIPYNSFPNNQSNQSLCSYGNSSGIDLKQTDYSLGGNNLPSNLNYDKNNPSNSANYSQNSLNSPSSSGNFNPMNSSSSGNFNPMNSSNSGNFNPMNSSNSGNFNPMNPSSSGKFNSNNPSSSGKFNSNNPSSSGNFNKNNPSNMRNFNENNPSGSKNFNKTNRNNANYNKNNTRGRNNFRNKSGGWGQFRGNSNKNKKKFSI